MSTSSFGRRAEGIAAAHLESLGMQIVQRNAVAGGEIDIVALEGDIVVICEVKARSIPGTRPAEAVTRAKMRRISRAALGYLSRKGWLEREIRFDVVEVWHTGDAARVNHIPAAFNYIGGR